MHLTNDAIQKHSEDYGKYESANKLSYIEFQRYIDFSMGEKAVKPNFKEDIIPQIKAMVLDTF